MIIFKQFTFDSAHFLPAVPPQHKCKEIHGHTYKVIFYFEGPVDEQMGWVVDFGETKKIIRPLIEQVDHKMLNNIAGLENPTCENMAIWFWNKVKPHIPQLKKIELHETPTSGAVYEGA